VIEQIKVGGFDKNFAYIIHDGEECAVVDPSGDVGKISAFIEKKALRPVAILITHTHFDHIDGIDVFRKTHPVPIYMHTNARKRVKAHDDIKRIVKDGDEVKIGALSIQVLHTPGHINDAVCYYIEKEGALISGDTLFVEGCGRVDSEADAEVLYESLQRLKELPDETEVFPGHDYGSKPHSTIAHEKRKNRFFLAENLENFKKERLCTMHI